MTHKPVLLNELIEALSIKPNGIYVDCTFGRGGHSKEILEQLNQEGRLLALDKDPDAVLAAKQLFGDDKRFQIFHASFSELREIATSQKLLGKVTGIIMDLGVSSPQLDKAERGFSFLKEGPLDMRMDPQQGISVAQWIEQADDAEIAEVLKRYGEERYAKRIAKAIVAAREKEAICTTTQLAEIVKLANPAWERHKHPATRTFQALRIFINAELNELEALLSQCLGILESGGRLAVISFHSLEDRMVKRFMRQHARGNAPKEIPLTPEQMNIRLKILGKAIKPSEKEINANPRSRSAVLRVAEKIK